MGGGFVEILNKAVTLLVDEATLEGEENGAFTEEEMEAARISLYGD